MKALHCVVVLSAALLTAGCAATLKSTQIPTEPASVQPAKISIANSMPKAIPSKAVPFEHGQYLYIPAASATALGIGMVMPVPFVTDIAMSQINKTAAHHYKDAYVGIDPYQITVDAIAGHSLFTTGSAEISLHPFVVIHECSDGVYRLSVVMQAEKEKWAGRYVYHLPTTIPKADIAKPTNDELASFRSELQDGARLLISLIERDSRGELTEIGKVELSSYYIVGSRVAGLLSPDVAHVRNASLVEEADDHIIVRSDGQPTAEVQSFGLQFGVHYFKKNQLNFFKKL